MRKTIFSVLAAGLVVTWGANVSAADKAAQGAFDRKAAQVNETAKRPAMINTAIHGVSVETGVPEDRLQEMHRKNPDAGPAGILIASVMADETKQPPEKFLQSHMKGKTWEAIIRDNHVPVSKINDRLDHLERFLANSETGNTPRRRQP
jgi:predicted alpha-1,6-mannanase (GH76 family)